jgi:hypothetical protein
MSKSYSLFNASPREFLQEYDATVGEHSKRLRDLEIQSEKMLDLYESMVREQVPLMRRTAPMTRWSYDARLPNLYFPEAYEPELGDNGVKRWVSNAGRIGASLALDCGSQYDFVVEIVSFVSEEARSSFALKVNGKSYGWLSTAANRFWTVILEDREASTLDFDLSIDPATCPDGSSVSFAFANIDIRQRL